MEIVFWVFGIVALLIALAYAAIGAALLLAKYRMHQAPLSRDVSQRAGIVDLRYRTQ